MFYLNFLCFLTLKARFTIQLQLIRQKNIVHAYNKEHLDNPIGEFSVHQIRHSFCSRLVDQDVNIKVIQAVMGHSDFQTTMNVYAEVSEIYRAEKKKIDEFEELEGKMIGFRRIPKHTCPKIGASVR